MRFKAAREAAGLTVLDVANTLKVSRQAVYLWERGVTTPSASKLVALSKLYGVTVDRLLKGGKNETRRAV